MYVILYISHLLFFNICVNCREKEPSRKFFGVMIIFHEVMKLQSFEFGVSGSSPRMYAALQPCSFCIFWLILGRSNLLQSFVAFLIIFHKVNIYYKFHLSSYSQSWSFISTQWTSSLRINIHYGVNVNFSNFWLMSFCFMIKKNHFK